MRWNLINQEISQRSILENTIQGYFEKYNFLICKKSLLEFLKIENYMKFYFPIIKINSISELYNFFKTYYRFDLTI
jgi:hypothetical protein